MSHLVHEILKWSALSAFITVLLFILQYTAYSPWWKDPVGRTVVSKDIALLLSLIPFIGGLFFDFTALESEVAAWVYAIAIMLISVIMIWRMAVWYRVKKKTEPGWREPAARAVTASWRATMSRARCWPTRSRDR